MPPHIVSEEDCIRNAMMRIQNKTIYEGDCWRFTGKHVGNGYGEFSYRDRSVRINRFIAYVYFNLPLDAAQYSIRIVCHKLECKFKDCWNPDHLYVGTPARNVADAIKAGTFHYGTQNLNGGSNYNKEKADTNRQKKYRISEE